MDVTFVHDIRWHVASMPHLHVGRDSAREQGGVAFRSHGPISHGLASWRHWGLGGPWAPGSRAIEMATGGEVWSSM